MRSRAIVRRPLGASILWLLAACSTASTGEGDLADREAPLPRQLQARQVIVTLASAPQEHWDLMGGEIARVHGLHQLGAFPLPSLGVHCVALDVPEGRSVDDVLARLARDPRVESAQRNQVFRAAQRSYGDPYAALQHGARAIQADLAHRQATGKGVRIAVVDTGVETTHPDLRGRVVRTANFVEWGERTFALDRHGTAVAGVIAARAGNDIGIFGIAPDAKIVAIKACWHRAAGSSEALCSSWTLARAVDLAIVERVQVLNLSVTGPRDPLLARLLMTAIERQGIVVVAAVPGTDLSGFPASLPPVIGVVAADHEGRVPAPGVRAERNIVVAPGVDVLTTVPRHAYDLLSGSSMAAAHVSGVAALLLERNPRQSPRDIYHVLVTSGRPVTPPGESEPSLRFVNACAAVAMVTQQDLCS